MSSCHFHFWATSPDQPIRCSWWSRRVGLERRVECLELKKRLKCGNGGLRKIKLAFTRCRGSWKWVWPDLKLRRDVTHRRGITHRPKLKLKSHTIWCHLRLGKLNSSSSKSIFLKYSVHLLICAWAKWRKSLRSSGVRWQAKSVTHLTSCTLQTSKEDKPSSHNLTCKAGSYWKMDQNQQTRRIYLHDSLREFDGTESRLHLLILKFL